MPMEIVITYDKINVEDYIALGGDIERTLQTHVEVYTLPIVAVARMDALSKAGIAACLTVTRSPIVEA